MFNPKRASEFVVRALVVLLPILFLLLGLAIVTELAQREEGLGYLITSAEFWLAVLRLLTYCIE